MSRTINITGKPNATLAFVVKHKKDGSTVLRIHPLQFTASTGTPVSVKEYSKKDALITLKFENVRAMHTAMWFLDKMKTNQVYREGQAVAYKEAGKQFDKLTDLMGKDLSGSRFKHVDNLSELPDRVLTKFMDDVLNEIARRDMDTKLKEKPKQEENPTEVVQ